MAKTLYLIKSAHYIKLPNGEFVNLVGYGIQSNIDKRLRCYIGHTGTRQEYALLYYGPDDFIRDLERYVKHKWKSSSVNIGDWTMEWLDPESGKTLADLEKFVDDKIAKDELPIRKVKRDHLPFTTGYNKPLYTMSAIKAEPERFLEPVVLTSL